LEVDCARTDARPPEPGGYPQRLAVPEGVEVFALEILLEGLLRADALRLPVRSDGARIEAAGERREPGPEAAELALEPGVGGLGDVADRPQTDRADRILDL